MRRGRSKEREADRLASAFEQRRRDLADREEELQAADDAAEREIRAANLARGLDEITPAEHAEGIATAKARVHEARAACDRARDVLAEVAHAAADAAEAVATAAVAAANEDLQREEAGVEEAEALLGQRHVAREAAEERLAIVQRTAKDARAPFDAVAAAEAERRARKDQAKVSWHAQEMHKPDDPGVEPWHRDALAAEIARRERENEEYRKRLRERPDRVGAEGDPDALRQGDEFPLVEIR